jgi:hypothetical protein
MNLYRNKQVITIRIIMTLLFALIGELLLLFHLLLILAGKGPVLQSFLQVFLPVVGVYAAYSFSLVPHDGEFEFLRAALLANPAGTNLFAGLSIIFVANSMLSISFAIVAGVAFVAGLLLLVKYFRRKKPA